MIKEINEKLAEETGWHIGDGSMNFYLDRGKQRGLYQLRGHIEDDKAHYLQRIKPLFEEIYGLKINLREMPSTRVFGFQIWNNNLIKFKESLGLPLGKKRELEVPSKLLLKEEWIAACIRGIFDTDGCLYLEEKNKGFYPKVSISTISLTLANQLIVKCKAFGLRATKSISTREGKGNRLNCYKVEMRGAENLHKFFKIIQPKNPKHLAKYNKFLVSTPKT